MAGGPPDYASGFLATPALLVTNNHVLPDPETASRSLAEFEYELDLNFVERRGRIFPFAPFEAFYTSAELDFTIVAISSMGHDGTPITDFGILPLIPESGKGIPGEYVSIIQHPGGATKQVVMRENKIIALDESRFPGIGQHFIHYTADTERGLAGFRPDQGSGRDPPQGDPRPQRPGRGAEQERRDLVGSR
jgi:endonuclease G